MIRILLRHLVCLCCLTIICVAAEEREGAERNVVVTGEDEGEHDEFTELGEYGQPAWAERSRMSSTTNVYVLSPYEAFVGNIWEANSTRHRKPTHDFVQEIDFGLPHRFELGIENELGLFGSDAHETSETLEARYAFADWNKVPLNPAISLEYVLGFSRSAKLVSRKGLEVAPNAVALRLLLGQNFGDHFGYGVNFSVQRDVSRDNGAEFEIAQAVGYGIAKGKVELGAEMRYTHATGSTRIGEEDDLVIGPSIGWKPTRQIRIHFAPLFGCTDDSPRLASFLLISYEFGGAEAIVSPIPHD
jgi:hypothetical protein